MKMNFDLSMQQTQKLIMTQQLQMAIKMLQLSSLELNEYIQNELIDNPILESGSSDKQEEDVKVDWKEAAGKLGFEDYDNNYQDDDEHVSPLNFIAREDTLRDYLLFQMCFTIRDSKDAAIGEYLIDNIDSSGYLRIGVEEAALHLNTRKEKVEDVLEIIQSFDPLGVGARNIKECLIIQLSRQGLLNEQVETVVDKYLNEIGENKYNIIARELSITPKQAQAIGDMIKGLEPKPGRGFADNNDVKYIVPDVIVEKVSGQYMVVMNDRAIPRLSINPYYRSILMGNDKDEKTLEYIKKKLDSAAWLIKSIEQRKNTIYNVVGSIISVQKDFLDKGLDHLKPLTLKDVADDIGVHESTVSRAVNGKYVQTPRGLYQLKFFFTRGLDAAYGNNISSESIKKSISEIIEGEDPRKPMSDQKITDKLNKDGISISRRTVAKYREEMEIPSTSRRKRF